ncbi:hypothetical protein J7438_11980 [Thalassotalea sp. G20_0]|uniref:hypothetical protein n=1 Tax=Thalassotalea sp. G20_0 TaxID=2821093 RepID=UPI001ADA9AD1|nr:hypothetical protein [Thalassotalea sp. G20_0]MBO9494794.1 hypothetical protein [Thalassotalea sp. G20_0]
MGTVVSEFLRYSFVTKQQPGCMLANKKIPINCFIGIFGLEQTQGKNGAWR